MIASIKIILFFYELMFAYSSIIWYGVQVEIILVSIVRKNQKSSNLNTSFEKFILLGFFYIFYEIIQMVILLQDIRRIYIFRIFW